MKKDDVEMVDVETKKEQEVEKEKTPEEIENLAFADILSSLSLVEKTVSTTESRFLFRVLRQIPQTRKKITTNILIKLINTTFPTEQSENAKAKLLEYIKDAAEMEVEEENKKEVTKELLPEIEIYIRLLVTIYLLDNKKYVDAQECSTLLIERMQTFYHRATLNALTSSCYFYYGRCFEVTDQLADIREKLLSAYRTSCIRYNEPAQATLLNLLLRNYLRYNLFDQADKLSSKTTFPESASSNEFARYFFYQGRIKSVQLDYTEASNCLQQAIRKAPQYTGLGFRRIVHKLFVIVQLLMGEIPDRTIFNQQGLRKALRPYFRLTRSIRIGDIEEFNAVLIEHQDIFKRDETFTLIQRLRHNVIKTALKRISVSYSRISIQDIADKIFLDSVEDTEYIVAKAIRDGVIDATIDHKNKFIQSKENVDIYSTQEPQIAFHNRINFCLNIHNEAVKAMRFPENKKTQTETNNTNWEAEVDEAIKELEEEEDL